MLDFSFYETLDEWTLLEYQNYGVMPVINWNKILDHLEMARAAESVFSAKMAKTNKILGYARTADKGK